jgi:streptogramin lyase
MPSLAPRPGRATLDFGSSAASAVVASGFVSSPIRSVTIVLMGLAAIGWAALPARAGHTYQEITTPHAPVELAFGGGGMWYTTGNYFVGKVDPDLTVHEFATTGQTVDITAGLDGNMWFAEAVTDGFYTNGLIGSVTPDGAITEFSIPTYGADPIGITVGPDGNVWFTENDAAKIGRITPSGSITEYPMPHGVIGPAGIATGADGNLWFVDHDSSLVGRMTPAGDVSVFRTPTRFSTPNNITLGPDGNMWFTENDAVARVTPDGVITEFPVTTNWYVWDIVSLRSSLIFTEPGTAEFGRVRMDGQLRESTVPRALSGPWAAALSDSGDLWFSETGTSQLAIISL